MSSTRKNLLEAFQRTAAEKASTPDAPGGAPRAEEPASPEPPQPSLFEPLPAAPPPVGRRQLMAIVVIGFVLSFVLGFLVGRGSSSETLAATEDERPSSPPAPSNQPRSFQTRPEPGAQAEESGDESRLQESALFDTSNTYTVVVATYLNTNPDPAWATYEHLREARIEVFPPVASENLILVVAGAAPKTSELRRTLSEVQELKRDGVKAYADAYIQQIDRLIPRD